MRWHVVGTHPSHNSPVSCGSSDREQLAAKPRTPLSRSMTVLAVVSQPVLWALAARFVWEQTVLSWERGPQAVGFSLAHSHWGAICFLGAAASVVGVVVTLIGLVISVARARSVSRGLHWLPLAMLASYGLAWGAILMPYSFWQAAFIVRVAGSPYSGRFVIKAAGSGDVGLLRALLENGARIDSRSVDGMTALHAAAWRGQGRAVEVLLAGGADPEVLDDRGQSPVDLAMLYGHSDVAESLRRRVLK